MCHNSRRTGGIGEYNRMTTESHNGTRAISVTVGCPYFYEKERTNGEKRNR